MLFHNKKDWNGAEAAFRKSAELDRNNPGALIKLGEVQAASGHADLALATYKQSIKDHPREAGFYILTGQLYEARQDWKSAQNAYEKALELKPTDPIASNNLANVMLQTGGNIDVALSLAQAARRVLPDSSDVADTLGWICTPKGAYESAISLLQEALKLRGKSNVPRTRVFTITWGWHTKRRANRASPTNNWNRCLSWTPTIAMPPRSRSSSHN